MLIVNEFHIRSVFLGDFERLDDVKGDSILYVFECRETVGCLVGVSECGLDRVGTIGLSRVVGVVRGLGHVNDPRFIRQSIRWFLGEHAYAGAKVCHTQKQKTATWFLHFDFSLC
jgi:hypothetical protein